MFTIFILSITVIIAGILGSRYVYFKLLSISKSKGLVDNPNGRKIHHNPVPITGGITISFGIIVGVLVGYCITTIYDLPINSCVMISVICSMFVLRFIGFVDDLITLTPVSRLMIETIILGCIILTTGECIDSFHNLWGIQELNWWIAVPMTIFAALGIINSINMIDGVNGLSSGLILVYCLLYGTIFIEIRDTCNIILAFAILGSIVPFFIRNVFGLKSMMFLGDSGTMMLGFAVAWFTINILHSNTSCNLQIGDNQICSIALVLAILIVPITDTLRVMTMRILRKTSPLKPDKTHLHHIFIAVGCSHGFITLIEIFMNLSIVLILYVCIMLGASIELQLYIVIASGLLIVCGTYLFLSYHVRRRTDFLHKLVSINTRVSLGRTIMWRYVTKILNNSKDNTSTY